MAGGAAEWLAEAAEWLAEAAGYIFLRPEGTTCGAEHKILRVEYKTRGAEYKILRVEYKTRGAEYKTLRAEHKTLGLSTELSGLSTQPAGSSLKPDDCWMFSAWQTAAKYACMVIDGGKTSPNRWKYCLIFLGLRET